MTMKERYESPLCEVLHVNYAGAIAQSLGDPGDAGNPLEPLDPIVL